jgi:1-acyl-sn-glycerol-3-phosphate acyltransferase
MSSLRAAAIVTVFLVATAAMLPVQWLLIKLHRPSCRTMPHRYHRFVCWLFGIRISQLGHPVRGGVLLVANHTGWLDIPVLSACRPVSFVAKSEVNRWPFFGTLARMQQSVFVRRERTHTIGNRDSLRDRLLQGDALVIFPEGTSSDGNRVLPFRSGLMSAVDLAPDSGAVAPQEVAVQPVSIAHTALHGIPMGRENRPFFAWYGDMELVPHLWESLCAGPIDVVVEFHPAIALDQVHGRKELTASCEAAVRRGVIRALTGSRAGSPVQPGDAQPDATGRPDATAARAA